MNVSAWLNTLSTAARTLPIIVLYVTEGCNLRCRMCSYRNPLPNELSLPEIRNLARALGTLGLRHIVYSGGEPLLRRDFPEICGIFREAAAKQTLLTNGLLLDKRFDEIRSYLTEIIVSLDGARAGTHDEIRGVNSFDQIVEGIRNATRNPAGRTVSIRTVVHRGNFREIIEMVHLARSLGVDRVSFLSADILSGSFGRERAGKAAPDNSVVLNEEEVREFRLLVGTMAASCAGEFETGFISESPAKMYHLVEYYEALLGKRPFPRNRCNAPMVSAVVTSEGDIHPCFFLPSFGSIRKQPLNVLINSDDIVRTRSEVRAYTLERCRTCVCTLNVRPWSALLDRF